MANHDREENGTLLESNSLLDSELKVCNVCGEGHLTESCSLLGELKHVKDTPTISRARRTLPSGLKVVSLADHSTTVVACERFSQGAHFGPFQALLTTNLHPAILLPLKITGKSGNDGYYLDTIDEETCNWMCLVAPASSASEQNLICYEMKESIYFTAIKDILPGEELKVWYAFYYGLKLQALPLADESDSEKENLMGLPDNDSESKLDIKTNVGQEIGCELLQSLAQHLPAHSLGARTKKDCWQCRFCEKQECNVALYAKHLMTHYKPHCHLCNSRFYSDKALSKHQKTRHPNVEGIGVANRPNGNNDVSVINSDSSLNAERQGINSDKGEETPVVSLENWDSQLKEDTEMIESDVGGIANSANLSNDNDVLENFEKFCSFVPVDKDSQEVITINNLNTSEVVQTQLVLTDDGSVVYHVANIPDGILATEMDKLELPVIVVNDVNCPEIGVNDPNEWNIPTDDFAASSQSVITENCELPHSGTGGTEPYRADSKVEEERGGSVALLLLNNVKNKNPPEEPENRLEQPDNQIAEFNHQEISDEQDLGIVSQSMNDSTRKPDSNQPLEAKEISTNSLSCDICAKTFEKSAYLYRHLRKHTGEFTCINCLAVFARKETLQSHSCTRPMIRFPCHICGKKFSSKRYLQRHIPLHTGEFTCDKCSKHFVSKLSLACHRCRVDKIGSDHNMKCLICDLTFTDPVKLQAHSTLHSETNTDGIRTFPASSQVTRKVRKRKASSKPIKNDDTSAILSVNDSTCEISGVSDTDRTTGKNSGKGFICEICGSIFKSFSSMKTHRFLHGERRFECEICGKRFYRKDVLQEHISVHQSPQLPCAECGKKFKTKKSLEVHMMIHAGAKRFTCNHCGKGFYQKGNLIKHQRVHTPPEERTFACQHCSKSFTSQEYLSMHTLEHTQGKIFQCTHCSKSFVKKHLLETHQQTTHSNRAFLCRYCNTFMRYRQSARRHLEQQHPDKEAEWSRPDFVDQMLAELPPDSPLLKSGTSFPGQQEIRQEHLLALRRQHFGTNITLSNDDDKGEISALNQSTKDPSQFAEITQTTTHSNSGENPGISTEEIATLTLTQQVDLLTDSVMDDSHFQPEQINVISVPFEEKTEDEEILLDVVDPELQQAVVAHDSDSHTAVSISMCPPETQTSKGESSGVSIGGNTYILQDQIILEEDDMTSGDIVFYVRF